MTSGADKIRGDTRPFTPEDYATPNAEPEGDVKNVVSPTGAEATKTGDYPRQMPVDREPDHKPGHFPDFMEEGDKKKKKHKPQKESTPSNAMEKLIKLEDAYLEARFQMEKCKRTLREEMGHGTSGPVLQRLEEQFVIAEEDFKVKRKKVLEQLKIVAEQEAKS